MFVEPNGVGVKVFRAIVYPCAFGEEQQVCFDGGVWGEYSLGQADNGVQLAIAHQ